MTRYKGAWPPPVYVATFANGETGRAMFASPRGKPLDFEAGRRMVCHLYRPWLQYDYEERKHYSTGRLKRFPTYQSIKASLERYYSMPPRLDLVSGYVEFDGQNFPDPMNTKAKPRSALSAVEKLIVSVNALSASDRQRLKIEVFGAGLLW